MTNDNVLQEHIDARHEQLEKEAGSGGYLLNPDISFAKSLVDGILVNERRYGYPACPCRLASGRRAEDLDIICPCYYRDADIAEYGACYCALYVSKEVYRGEKGVRPIPERRAPPEERETGSAVIPTGISLPVYRCGVCGYLCAREYAPERCPICHAEKDRFAIFMR
jgi:ferredoxin-thioredoxin reductase catalytic chain